MFRNKNQWLFEADSATQFDGWICPYDGQAIFFNSGPASCSNPNCPSHDLKDFAPSRKIAESAISGVERLSDYGYTYQNGVVYRNWLIHDEDGFTGVTVSVTDIDPENAVLYQGIRGME